MPTSRKSGAGRPPSWLLDPSSRTTPAHDVAEVDDRARITIPARFAAGADSLDRNGEGLLILRDAGKAELWPWEPKGVKVMEERSRLSATDDTSKVKLLMLSHRYARFDIAGDRRLTLHPPTLMHLNSRRVVPFVVLVRFADRLELWSPSVWKAFVAENEDLLKGLP